MIQETIVDQAFIKEMEQYRQPPNKEIGLIEACSQNVVLFAERMLGFRLYSWQVDFLRRVQQALDGNYWTKEFAVMTSRQIGKSTAVAIFSVWCVVFNKYPGKDNVYGNTVVGVVSASEAQSTKLIREMKKMMRVGDSFMLEKYGDAFPKNFFTQLVDESEQNNTATITLKPYNPNKHGQFLLIGSKVGSVIKSYPPTTVVLGETFSVEIIDEAGMTDRISDTFFDEYIYPTGNKRDAVRLRISTPWQTSGFFYRLMDPDDVFGGSPAERLIFTLEAIKEEDPEYHSVVMRDVEKKRRDGKLDEVNRAYYCRFVKGEQAYFNPEKVMESFTKEYGMLERYLGKCDMGIDFGGQVSSRTAVTISKMDEKGNIKRLYHRAYPVGEDLSLLDDIAELRTLFNVQRTIPDDCPAGDFLIRMMKEKGWDIHPMNFKADKVKKYGAFRVALNNNKIQSYEDDELKIEMLSLQFEHGKQNSIIRHAPGERDDLIDSFVMSCYFYIVDNESTFEFYDLSKDEEEHDEERPIQQTKKKVTWWRQNNT